MLFKNNNKRLTLNVITMNRRGLLTHTVKLCDGYFDEIRIVDGVLNDSAVDAMKHLDCTVYSNAWAEDVSKQYNFLLGKCGVGEWALFLDDDECPSIPLLIHVFDELKDADSINATHIEMPMMVIQDGIPQNSEVEFVQQCDGEGFGDEGKFYSRRFIKVATAMYFEGTTHCGIPDRFMGTAYRTRYPLYHYKEIDSWLMGDLWPAFINPEGHGVECGGELKRLCEENGIKTSHDIVPVFKEGKISNQFKEFLWANKWPDGALAHWWMIYFLKYHPEQLPEGFCFIGDDTSRRYLTYMKGHSHNILAKRMCIHPIIKQYLLDKGVEIWQES